MGTPLKRLLSPRFISEISPRSPNMKIKNGISRRLNFGGASVAKHNVKINVIGCKSLRGSEQCLLVNSPNKLDILKNGLKSLSELNVLGRGAFGTVVRGQYKGETVAVKVIKTRRKLREYNALKLNHRNVVKIKDIIMRNEVNSMIIMEHLENSMQLQTVLNDENFVLTLQGIANLALDISGGLLYCHENKVLHLDLKPSNILVCGDGSCKICDFGNSWAYEGQYVHEGTAVYTAPEILVGDVPSPSSDIYSLGIILWQMRYREVPYSQLQDKEVIIYKVVKYNLRPESEDGVETVDDFCKLYKSCWASEPGVRPKLSSVIETLKKL